MKILHINAVYGMGSTGNMVRDISYKLIEQGHQSVAMWATGCRADASQTQLIRIGSTFDHKLHALLRRLDAGQGMHSKMATKRACKKILALSPDVVHLHNLHSNYVHLPTLLSFLAKNNIPTLITLHDCWFLTGYCAHYFYYNNCQKWLTGCADCPAVCKSLKTKIQKRFAQRKNLFDQMNLYVNGVSEWTTEAAKGSALQSAKQIKCICNWVDTDVFKPVASLEKVKQKYGIPQNKKLLLGVSQIWSNSKGLDSFVELADRLADTVHILLVGQDGGIPQKDNLKCIGFTSNVNELVALYSAADLVVNPSNVETFGLVTVEAMACGTPVVAYNNSGSAELITKDCGILAEDGNKEALLAGVKEILKQDKSVFAVACRNHVCERFEKNKQIEEYIKFYQEISV